MPHASNLLELREAAETIMDQVVHRPLPIAAEFSGYAFEEALGVDPVGITYRAREIATGRLVAIKEYYPRDLALRGSDGISVLPMGQEKKHNFLWGLERFLREANALAGVQHQNIVQVLRFFAENGTAYLVMAYVDGEDLGSILQRTGTLGEKELAHILTRLLGGLATVHGKGIQHRDISPDHIRIRPNADPILLSFGAARQALGSRKDGLPADVSPGYAAIEQYHGLDKQGPQTDIYALGAVLYRAVAGRTPPTALIRATAARSGAVDPLVPAVSVGKGRYSPEFLEGIDRALVLDPAKRPQSVGEWQAILFYHDKRKTAPSAAAPTAPAATGRAVPAPATAASGIAAPTADARILGDQARPQDRPAGEGATMVTGSRDAGALSMPAAAAGAEREPADDRQAMFESRLQHLEARLESSKARRNQWRLVALGVVAVAIMLAGVAGYTYVRAKQVDEMLTALRASSESAERQAADAVKKLDAEVARLGEEDARLSAAVDAQRSATEGAVMQAEERASRQLEETISRIEAEGQKQVAALVKRTKQSGGKAVASASGNTAAKAKAAAAVKAASKSNALDDAKAGLDASLKGDYDTAIKLYTKAAAAGGLSRDNLFITYTSRGNAYFNKKNMESAIADYTRAIDIKPNEPDAYYNRCVAFGTNGQRAAAIQDCEKVMELNPNDTDARAALEKLKATP